MDRTNGNTLRELLQADPEDIMGPGYDPKQSFPILVKWLDCSQRLSLQAHPPADVAEQLGGEPKTECWYMADTSDDAALIVGLRKGLTRPQFEGAIACETLKALLHRFPGERLIADCPEFHIRQINLEPGQRLEFQAGDQPRILSLISGLLKDSRGEEIIARSENVLILYSA